MKRWSSRFWSVFLSGAIAVTSVPSSVYGSADTVSVVEEAESEAFSQEDVYDTAEEPAEEFSEEPQEKQEPLQESEEDFAAEAPENFEETAGAGEEVSSEVSSQLEQGSVAKIGETQYSTLQEAVAAAAENAVITLIGDCEITQEITVNKSLTITVEQGKSYSVKRGADYKGILFRLTDGKTLKLGTVEESGTLIIDGGAVWEIPGDHGTNTAAESAAQDGAVNTGIAAQNPMIQLDSGHLYVYQNTILQNNENTNNTGGAVNSKGGGSANMYLYGAIKNNKTNGSGAGIKTNGYLTFYSGAALTGNYSLANGGAVENHNGGVINNIVNGVTITGNRASSNGGAMWLNGATTINGGTFSENYSANGGAVYMDSASGRTIKIYGGSFQNNRADQKGADLYLNTEYHEVKGSAQIGEIYIPDGKKLKITGALTGKIGVAGADLTGIEGTIAAEGSGYTLKDTDAVNITAAKETETTQFRDGQVYRVYAPAVITEQPKSIERVEIGGDAVLSVSATSLSGGNLSYQWYECKDANGAGAEAIEDAAESSYTVDTSQIGTRYFYCEIQGEKATLSRTEIVSVKIADSNSAEKPVIIRQPSDVVTDLQKEAVLQVDAKVDDQGTLSYQWYRAEDEQTEGTPVEGAVEASYRPDTTQPGKSYYYCVITNTNSHVTNQITTAQSNRVSVTVNEAVVKFNGKAYSKLADVLTLMQEQDGTLEILKDLEWNTTLNITRQITVQGAEGQEIPKLTVTDAYKNAAFQITTGELTLKNIQIDGGANWQYQDWARETYLQRGSNNTGRKANKALVVMSGGKLSLLENASLQNNQNQSGTGGVDMVAGTLELAEGSSIRNCNGSKHGGAVYATTSSSTIRMTGGTISGNEGLTSTGGICADTGTVFELSGGSISNNFSAGRAGAVFINGTMTMTGGTISHNYAKGNGGGIIHTSGTLNLLGGEISHNTTEENGGGVASLGGTISISNLRATKNQITGSNFKGAGIYAASAVRLGTIIEPAGIEDEIYFEKTITLTLNYGDGRSESESLHYLQKYSLPTPSRNGYEFKGWFTQPAGVAGGEQVVFNPHMTLSGNTTLYAKWKLTATAEISITQQPESGVYYIEDSPSISIQAEGTEGIQYTWMKSSSENGNNAIDAGTGSTLTLPTEKGTYYYYCVVTGQNAVDVQTEVFTIRMISREEAEAPEFISQPQNVDSFTGEEVRFSAEAESVDNGTITYQWYKARIQGADPEHDTVIEGATGPVYVLHPEEAQTGYYYVAATNTITKPDGTYDTRTVFSDVAVLKVHNKIEVQDISSSDKKMSSAYWETYRVGSSESEDGYVTSITSAQGSWNANTSNPEKALDGNWGTFWETRTGNALNALEFTFNKKVKINEIIYATRQDGQKGKGYPTVLTVYASDQDTGAYKEVGVAKSEIHNSYVSFVLPETVDAKRIKLEFTETQHSWYGPWASAAEVVLLRDPATVLSGSASVSGTAVLGGTLTVHPEIATGSQEGLRYQWQRSADGETYQNIPGADQVSYTITEADKDQFLRAVVKGKEGDYTGSILSEPYKGTFTAAIEGEAAINKTVKAVTAYTDSDTEFKYQWQTSDDGQQFTDINGANSQEYTLPVEASQKFIRVVVQAKEASMTAYSDPVYAEAVKVQVEAIMTGAPQVGSTLTASLSSADIEGLTYQWQIAEQQNGTFADISQATAKEYLIGEENLNQYIRVQITITQTGKVLTSEAWQIMPAGTYYECEGNAVYLSDLPRTDLVDHHVGWSDLKFDKNIAGGTMSLLVNGQIEYFMKGLGAHAPAYLIYDIEDYVKFYHYTRFIAQLGIDSGRNGAGDGVTFKISVSQDRSSWEVVEETGVVRSDSDSVHVDVPVQGAKYLKIEIGKNGNDSSDHSLVADAKLANNTYDPDENSMEFIKPVEQYDTQIKQYVQEHSNESYEQMIEDEAFLKLLLQRSFVDAAGYTAIKAFSYDTDYIETLKWFMDDLEALKMYIGGGIPDGSYSNSIEVLNRLYHTYREDMQDPNNGTLYKKMIITLSLTHAGNVTFWADSSQKSDPVRRYSIYKKLYLEGLLVSNIFRNLEVEEMRWVMNNIIDDEEIEWLNYYVRVTYHKGDMNKQVTSANFTPGPYWYIRYTFGYQYGKDIYYSEEKKEEWQTKYSLTNETAEIPDSRFDLNVAYASGHPKLWIVFEEGAVCGGISKTGSNICGAFGVPSAVIGQPGHAAYLQFGYTDVNAEAEGTGTWSIQNNISGWSGSEKGERLPLGWGSTSWDSFYSVSYVLMAQHALNEPDKYYKALWLVKLADVMEEDAETQIGIYEEALQIQNINMDAWVGLIDAYKRAGKGENDFLKLASGIAEALVYFPLPMWDITENLIKPQISSTSGLAALSVYQQTSLARAKTAGTGTVAQPDATRTMANYLLGNHDLSIATFSFDGDRAGEIVLTEAYAEGGNKFQYSLDAGEHWASAGEESEVVTSTKLTEEELKQVNAEDDILVKLYGTEVSYTIDITEGSMPSGLYKNEKENRLIGDISKLEWSDDDGQTWQDMDQNVRFAGVQTISVRKKAAGTQTASDIVTYNFQADTDTDARKYITINREIYVGCSTEETAKGQGGINSIDGNINTLWHTAWAGNDSERSVTVKFDEPLYLSGFDYTPRQSGTNGIFIDCDLYTSMDGIHWKLSGQSTGWAVNKNTKSMTLEHSIYAQYVKVAAKKGSGNFGSAAMLEFFEDTTVKDKTVTSMELQHAPNKLEYMRGEVLDKTGLAVLAHYEDGTSSTMEYKYLDFSKTVFDQLGEETITVSYTDNPEISPVSFKVQVHENTKTPVSIEVTALPEKTRYFVGESLDPKGVEVKVTYEDNTEGYLFEDQLNFSPEVLETAAKQYPVTVSYEKAGQTYTAEFSVEVTKTVTGFAVETRPDKRRYSLGEAIDLTGLRMKVTYEDQTEETLDFGDYAVSAEGFSNLPGTKNLQVTYLRKPEFTAQFQVIVDPYIYQDGLIFEAREDGTSFVSSYNKEELAQDGSVHIPSVAQVGEELKFPVTEIGADAFRDEERITNVVFPGSVQTIGENAFRNCNGIVVLYFTEHTDFSELTVADSAFSYDDDSAVVGGILYVANAALAQQLTERAIPALKNFDIRPVTEKVQSLEVTPPQKTGYQLGEELDLTGFKVMGILGDESGVHLELTENLYEITGYDSAKAGEQTITVALKENKDISDTFKVEVVPAQPEITLQPEGMDYDLSETVRPLKVNARIEDQGTLRYQWYYSASEDKTQASLIEGATEHTYTPEQEGTYYYFAAVSNNDRENTGGTAVTVYSEAVRVSRNSYEVRIGQTGYATLQEAVNAAEAKDSLMLLRDISISQAVTFNKNLTVNGQGYTIKRANADIALFEITGGKTVLENLTMDGGAVWQGTADRVLGRGTSNTGMSANRPLIRMTAGELVIEEDAVLQNNSNINNEYINTGGALRIAGGTVTLRGRLVNNHSRKFGGAALLVGGHLIIDGGEVYGNHGQDSGGTFCVDGSSNFTMNGGSIHNNKGNANGGVIWLKDGTASLNAGEFRDNQGNNGNIAYINGSGTVKLGNITDTGSGMGIDPGSNGKIVITGAPQMHETIKLPSGRTIQIAGDMTGAAPLTVVPADTTAGEGKIAVADTEKLAEAAARVLKVAGFGTYSEGREVFYGTVVEIRLTQDLPEEKTIMAGKPLVLSVQAEITTEGTDAQPVYQWYRCTDAEGSNAELISDATEATLNRGDCNEGVYYFYCEVKASKYHSQPVRSKIVKVTVNKFEPASKAIAKFAHIK